MKTRLKLLKWPKTIPGPIRSLPRMENSDEIYVNGEFLTHINLFTLTTLKVLYLRHFQLLIKPCKNLPT